MKRTKAETIQHLKSQGMAIIDCFDKANLVTYAAFDSFQVDGIKYDPEWDVGPYAAPMFELKKESEEGVLKGPMIGSDYQFRVTKSDTSELPEGARNPWKNLEWDPTIRL
jgi:hypothetical protein